MMKRKSVNSCSFEFMLWHGGNSNENLFGTGSVGNFQT